MAILGGRVRGVAILSGRVLEAWFNSRNWVGCLGTPSREQCSGAMHVMEVYGTRAGKYKL